MSDGNALARGAAGALLALVILGGTPVAAADPPAAPAEPPASIWARALDKTATYTAMAAVAEAALASALIGGGAVTAAGYLAVNAATAAATYYGHEVAWHYLGPAEADAETPLALQKAIAWRIVSGVRSFAVGGFFAGTLPASFGFAAAGQALDTVVYIANEGFWSVFASPIPR